MELAFLSPEFFKQHQPSKDFFAKHQSVYGWSEKILPVYEWEDVLFVACATPPADFPQTEKKIVLVRCDQEFLTQCWSLFAQKPEVKKDEADFFGDLSEIKAPFSNLSPAVDDMFAGLSKAPTNVSPAPTDDEFALRDEVSNAGAEQKPNVAVEDKLEFNFDEQSSRTVTLVKLDREAQPASEPKTQITQVAAVGGPTLDVQPEASTDIKSQINLKPSAVGEGSTFRSIFENLDAEYKKTAIFIKDGSTLKPWKWDENFKNISPTFSVNLNNPSPFKVVYRTLKPYHGYIVDNAVTKEFIAFCNEGEIPEHLTMAPVLIDEQFVGLILAIGGLHNDNKESLQLVEKAAQDLAQIFKDQPPVFKATAA